MWLTNADEKYTSHMIGTYYKGPNGEERWFEGSNATIDKNKYEVIK